MVIDTPVTGETFFGVKLTGKVASYEYYDGKLTKVYIETADGHFERLKTWVL